MRPISTPWRRLILRETRLRRGRKRRRSARRRTAYRLFIACAMMLAVALAVGGTILALLSSREQAPYPGLKLPLGFGRPAFVEAPPRNADHT
jgi:hypothetical protein